MTEPVVMSGSSLQTYLRCGHQWYLAYVVQLKEPPNLRMALGLAAHSAIEHNMVQKVTTRKDVSAEEMTDVFASNFDALATTVEDTSEGVGETKDDGIKLVRLHRQWVSPTIQPVMVEEAGQLTINDIPYSWTIDLTDEAGNIRDTKTTKVNPVLEKYMLQMTGYALGYRQRTGKKESDVVIDALVRTRVPRYTPLYGGPVNDRRIAAFAATLESTYTSINHGDFVPNGLYNGACNWCGYADICKYRQR